MNKDNNTPLHLAAGNQYAKTRTVELLLEKGASTDKYNNTPLHLALQKGRTDIVQLLRNGAAELVAHGNHA